MFSLCQFFIQAPENLNNTKGGRGDWISEISSRWTDCPHNGNRALSVGGSLTPDSSGPFVELGQFGRQVGRVARIGRHFGQTPADLTKGFCPARSTVGHHGNVVTHVSEILRNCYA
jgi:hypothetical protein